MGVGKEFRALPFRLGIELVGKLINAVIFLFRKFISIDGYKSYNALENSKILDIFSLSLIDFQNRFIIYLKNIILCFFSLLPSQFAVSIFHFLLKIKDKLSK